MFADSLLERDGFEPSVPRHNKLVSRPRRTSPVAMILCVGTRIRLQGRAWRSTVPQPEKKFFLSVNYLTFLDRFLNNAA